MTTERCRFRSFFEVDRYVEHIVPLELLNANEEARIVELCGDDPQIMRLQEMGLRAGVSLRMIRPGSPCIVAIAEQRISFRGNDNGEVLVEVLARR